MSERDGESRSPRVARWHLRRLLGRKRLEDQGAELEKLFRRRVERSGAHEGRALVLAPAIRVRDPLACCQAVPGHGLSRRPGRRPCFFAFAALIIGLGVAASSSVFSVMNALLLRPLPFEEPDRLVWVVQTSAGGRPWYLLNPGTRFGACSCRSHPRTTIFP